MTIGPLLVIVAAALLVLGVLTGGGLLLVGSIAVSLGVAVASIVQARVVGRLTTDSGPQPADG